MERISRSPGRRTLLRGIVACLLSVGVAGCAGPDGEGADDDDDEEDGDGDESGDEEDGGGEGGEEGDGEEDKEHMSRPTGLSPDAGPTGPRLPSSRRDQVAR